MTAPNRPRPVPLPYLQIDDLTVQIPVTQDPVELLARLSDAATANEVIRIPVVEDTGQPNEALVLPGNARLVRVHAIKNRPPST